MSTRPICPLDKLLAFLCAAFCTFALTPVSTGKDSLTSFIAFHLLWSSVTSHLCSVTTDRQLFLNHYITKLFTDFSATLRTRMATSFPFIFTRFFTAKFPVAFIIRMTFQRASMTAFQTRPTWLLTSSHGNFCVKIFGSCNADFVFVDLANKGQGVSNTGTSFQICNNILPNVTVFGEKAKISYAEETLSCTRESNACAVDNLEESDFLVFVTAHK